MAGNDDGFSISSIDSHQSAYARNMVPCIDSCGSKERVDFPVRQSNGSSISLTGSFPSIDTLNTVPCTDTTDLKKDLDLDSMLDLTAETTAHPRGEYNAFMATDSFGVLIHEYYSRILKR